MVSHPCKDGDEQLSIMSPFIAVQPGDGCQRQSNIHWPTNGEMAIGFLLLILGSAVLLSLL